MTRVVARLNFETRGVFAEEAVLFLHGWGGSVESFRAVIDLLPINTFIINLDFSGFGKSAEPSKSYCVEDYARDVKGLIDSLLVKRVSIVCHSFGGRVAIKMINLFPNLVTKVVFVDSAGIKPRKTLRQKFSIIKFKVSKFFVKRGFVSKTVLDKYGSDDYKSLTPIMKETFVRVVNEDLFLELANINIPTLIVWGEKDLDTPLYMAHKFNKKIAGSELVVYKDSGHFSYLDNLDDFVYILYKFLMK